MGAMEDIILMPYKVNTLGNNCCLYFPYTNSFMLIGCICLRSAELPATLIRVSRVTLSFIHDGVACFSKSLYKENKLFILINLDSKLSVMNICIAYYDIPKLIIRTYKKMLLSRSDCYDFHFLFSWVADVLDEGLRYSVLALECILLQYFDADARALPLIASVGAMRVMR
jgi:hypothetical protein